MSFIKQCLLNGKWKTDLGWVPKLLVDQCMKYLLKPGSHLTYLVYLEHRSVSTLARCGTLPTAILKGRDLKSLQGTIIVPMWGWDVEITEQVLFACQYYNQVESSCIMPLLVDFPDHPQQFNNCLIKTLQTGMFYPKLIKFISWALNPILSC